MLGVEQLKLIKEEMEKGNPIAVASKILNIDIDDVKEVRLQLFDIYGKDEIVHIIKNKIMPSNIQMAKNFAKTAGKVIKGAKRLTIYAKEEEIKKRESICFPCDFYVEGRCSKCGCFMKNKLNLQQASCPLKKW